MGFDPEKYRRRSIRLKGYDYRTPGAYFVTLCTRDRACLFGEVVDGEMRLNEWGEIARRNWLAIPEHFPHVELDEFVMMPNHVHGIIWIVGDDDVVVGATHASPLQQSASPLQRPEPPVHPQSQPASPLQQSAPPLRLPSHQPTEPRGPKPGSVGAIIGSFKSATARHINEFRGTPGVPVWQRNYYEHVIRNEESLNRIRQYILANPLCWHTDRENPNRTGSDPFENALFSRGEEGWSSPT